MNGIAIALLSCAFLALEFVFSKVLLRSMDPIVLTAITSFAAAFILLFILEARHKVWEMGKLKRKEFLVLLAVGLISGVLAQLLYNTGLKESTATNAVLLTRLNSLLIAIMGVVFIKEKLRSYHITGALLMVSGIVIIATKNFTVEVKPTHGDGLLLLAAFCWAAANILMKKYLSTVPPEVIVIGYYGFSGIFLSVLNAGYIMPQLTAEAILYLAALIIFVSIIGRYLWYYSLEHTSASNVGLASLSIPLFGVLYSTFLLGETLTTYHIIGGILIFTGLVVIEIPILSHEDLLHRLKRHYPHH